MKPGIILFLFYNIVEICLVLLVSDQKISLTTHKWDMIYLFVELLWTCMLLSIVSPIYNHYVYSQLDVLYEGNQQSDILFIRNGEFVI